MKTYTDLEQSKRLAEILPIESADMRYERVCFHRPPKKCWYVKLNPPFKSDDIIPCWSLTALLNIINNIKGWYPGIDAQVEDNKWQICMFSRETGSDTDLSSINEELVDVCYEVIVKLHDKNLI